MCDVVSRLFFSASSRFVHRSAHGIGNRIGIQNGFAFNISRSTSDGLNERTLASQEAFFIRIQNCDQCYFRNIQTFSQQVNADQNIENSGAQVTNDFHAFHRINV